MATIEEMANKAYPKDKLTAVEAVNRAKREGYIKACEEYESLTKICGWVARDDDGKLFLYTAKPFKDEYTNPGKWLCIRKKYLLPKGAMGIFSYDEPKEVELLIREV